jgi:O-acetyl-ADP-ribose deacetylase (regulator of RNase III)
MADEQAAVKVQYVKGDATEPVGGGMKVIVHSCNNGGGWGAGFVLALDQKWRKPGDVYAEWSKNLSHAKGMYKDVPFELGYVMMVPVEADITVANLIGQGWSNAKQGGPPVSYEALREGFESIRNFLENTPGYEKATIHMPRIGAVLGGGDWKTIEKIIQEEFCDHGIAVTVYDLPEDSKSAGRLAWGNHFDGPNEFKVGGQKGTKFWPDPKKNPWPVKSKQSAPKGQQGSFSFDNGTAKKH